MHDAVENYTLYAVCVSSAYARRGSALLYAVFMFLIETRII